MYRAMTAMVLAILAAWPAPAGAEVALGGYLVAREACPAPQSIRREANPGDVRLEPGRAYVLVAKNKPAATHYLIEVEGAEPPRRWVAVACGEHVLPADGSGIVAPPGGETGGGEDSGAAAGRAPAYVLAASWQPAFCEGKPDKVECATQTADRFDAGNFSLHGLWPQPRGNVFCHVPPDLVDADKAGDWARLPAPALTPQTRARLERAMPGTMSNLERHEWIKHGTCYGGDTADEYFAESVTLLDALNASPVRALFATSVGREVPAPLIREAFDEGFGAGAGDRVRIACRKDGERNLIVEMTIGLSGEIGEETALGALIAAARPTDPGCPGGVVDEVGLQ